MVGSWSVTTRLLALTAVMACGGPGAAPPDAGTTGDAGDTSPDAPPDASPDAVIPAAPTAPVDLVATRGNGQVSLTWSAPLDDGGSAITGYTVHSDPGGTTTVATTNLDVTGLENGTTYAFTVTATNAVGTGPESGAASATPATVPGAPSGVTAMGLNKYAQVTWLAPGDGGSAIIDYTIVVQPGNRTLTMIAGSPATVLGLTNGVAHTFTVAARNDVGTGPASVLTAPVVPRVPPCPGTMAFSAYPTVATSTLPIGGTTGDWNGDGHVDLAIIAYTGGTVRIVLGAGDGTFGAPVDHATGTQPYGIAAGDVDADGDLDLVVANNGSASISLLRGAGDGTFAAKVDTDAGGAPRDIALGDIDGDGDLDVVRAGSNVAVLKNDGTGAFGNKVEFAAGGNTTGLALGDLDGDGDLDLAFAAQTNAAIGWALNNGSGTFGTPIMSASTGGPTNVVAVDLDGDGDLDLAMSTALSDALDIRRNNGDATFQSAVYVSAGTGTATTIGVDAGDFDGDGDVDLVSSNFGDGTVSIFRNDGTGAFTIVAVAVGTQPRWVIAADIDEDAVPDLISMNGSANTTSVIHTGCAP
jgi:FG-GAP-like repeat/Fibronectin type III domain